MLSLGLGVGASAAAVAGAVGAVLLLIRRWWTETIGRRRAQAKVLDEIACSVSLDYIETVLGVPHFITHPENGVDERIYRLPGAWVSIQTKAGAVHLFSITVTDSKMWYHTGAVSLGIAALRLGKDAFDQASEGFDGEELWIGARHAGYIRHYYHANPGGFQNYWLSYNAVGAGIFDVGAGPYASGIYGNHGEVPPNPAKITANTLTILSAGGDVNEVNGRQMFGPHVEHLRLIPAERKKLNW